MMSSDTSIEEKQKYLREEILDKNYDGDEFTLWMDKTNEKGRISIDSRMRTWTVEYRGAKRGYRGVPEDSQTWSLTFLEPFKIQH